MQKIPDQLEIDKMTIQETLKLLERCTESTMRRVIIDCDKNALTMKDALNNRALYNKAQLAVENVKKILIQHL